VLPGVSIDLSTPAPRDARELFTCPVNDVWLEIGFGGGEHLVWQAQNNPDVGCIGCEVFEDGVVKLVTAIEDRALRNVLVCVEDARLLLRWLPPASISRVFVLFPDPWPKKKHAKRRLLSRDTLGLLARVMKPGGELRIATDIDDYLRTILVAFRGHPQFSWQVKGAGDWRVRGADWPGTRYEEKALREGRRRYFLRFLRTEAA